MRFLLFFVAISVFNFAQEEEGRRICKELCSEKYFGRGYVKQGDSLAAEFLALEFQKRKLKPLKGSYFQPFKHDVVIFPNDASLTLNGKQLTLGKDFLPDAASNSANIKWNYAYLDKSSLFDRNKLADVIQEIKAGTFNSCVIDYSNLSGDSLRQAKELQMALVTYFPVISITSEKFMFSVSDKQLNHALIYLHKDAFVQGGTIETKLTSQIKNNHTSRNVFALLPAKRKTKKTLLITAHYDHLGGIGNSCFFPGGNDNASGTSMLIALADELVKTVHSFNILFVAFAGEEAGLLGSKYFVEHPLIPLKAIPFVLNLDIMGSGEEGITVVNATEFPTYFDRLNTINQKYSYLKLIKKRGKAANSDHYWFSEMGIPAFFIYTMGSNKNYHDVFDTYEALTFNKYQDLVRLLTEFIVEL